MSEAQEEIRRLEMVIENHCDALTRERARQRLLNTIWFAAGLSVGAVTTIAAWWGIA